MTKSLIELNKVSVEFKTRKGFFRSSTHRAIENASFNIIEGETLGIIGRNGCGKSTLLKVIAGIIAPDSGYLIKPNINISLQTLSAGFDEELSGKDNALIASMFLGHTKQSAIENLHDICTYSELGDFFWEPVKSYSSGMRARLGFSVAVTMHADLLLIDEVLGVGDAGFRQKAESSIIDKMNSKQTVVFVSHSLGQVKRLCDRVIWFEEGKVQMSGKPQPIIEQYQKSLQ